MNKILWVIVTIFALALFAIKLFFMAMPEVVVTNLSDVNIKTVTIKLSSSRIVFDDILTSESSSIYYSINQADGAYKYTILFETDEIISGECGYLTQNEIGKIFRIDVINTTEVRCGG
ncbi:MAG: hypothetical protein GY808_06005 [Gammaproteobacteria bacterium]|nr:hypothetical protein [Gammaproteobacteria bacterium]